MDKKHSERIKLVWLVFMFLYITPISAQTIITGLVKDKENIPIENRIVTLRNAKDSVIIGYSITNNEGRYKITTNNKAPFLFISFSAFDLKNKMIKIENRTQTLNFVTSKSSIKLPEVMVKAPKLWNRHDTLNYLVSQFTTKKDIVIGDILKKLPGINVASNGAISYQGVGINKFYIENMDLLNGRYAIATNNINARDVSTVQVLENHQPIKALKNTHATNRAAINLKLKKKAKGIFSVNGVLGGGYCDEICWEEELYGAYFSKKNQRIINYKTNNSGKNISQEFFSYIPEVNGLRNNQIISMVTPSPPSINYKRYNFNNSHLFTLNNINKLKNKATLNYNFIYYSDVNKRKGLSRTSYLLPGDNTRIVTEDIASEMNTDRVIGELKYESNKNFSFFKEYLKISGSWFKGDGSIVNDKYLQQDFKNTVFNAISFSHWIKRKENEKGIEIKSINSIQTQPQYLHLSPGLYPDLLNEGIDYNALRQSGRWNVFSSYNDLSLLSLLVLGDIRLNPRLYFGGSHQAFHSHLELTSKTEEVKTLEDKSMRNDISKSTFNVGSGLNISYNIEKLKMDLLLPVNYTFIHLNNGLTKKTANKNILFFNPSFSATYKFNYMWEINTSYQFSKNIPDLNSLYEGYVLQNYRNLNHYENKFFESRNRSGNVLLKYKNLLGLFFAHVGFSIKHYKNEGIYNQVFNEDMLSTIKLLALENDGRNFSLFGKMSKGFDWKDLTCELISSWSKGKSQQMRQDELLYYHYEALNIGGKLKITPFSDLLVEYNSNWHKNNAYTDKGDKFNAIHSMTNSLSMEYTFPHYITFKTSFEDYYTDAVQNNHHFSFIDLGVYFFLKKARISLDWTNILNTKRYISYSYNSLNTYYSEYKIRPSAIMLSVRLKLF